MFPNSINDNFPLDYQYIFNNKQRIIDVRINGDSYYYDFVYEGTQDEAIIIEYYGIIYLDVYNRWDYEGDYDDELKGQTIEIEFEV